MKTFRRNKSPVQRAVVLCLVAALSFSISGCWNLTQGESAAAGATAGGLVGGAFGCAWANQWGGKGGDAEDYAIGCGAGVAAGALLGGIVGYIMWGPPPTPWEAPKKPALAPTPPPPPAPPVVQQKITLRGVHFDFNKSKIRPGDAAVLEEAASVLRKNPKVTVNVNGYCDSIGSDAYNLKLSQRRADAVVTYLVEAGIPSDRLIPHGYGKTDFVAPNDTAEGRAQNRRVELVPIE
jgi:OmpA-OmpF porin, OOP family